MKKKNEACDGSRRVDRLGPDFVIESGKIYQLFLVAGSKFIRASHISLCNGHISAAKTDYADDFDSNKKSYKKVPNGYEFVYFLGCQNKKTGFFYGELVWLEEIEEGEAPAVLIKIKPTIHVSLYRRSHGRMRDGSRKRVQLLP